MSFSEIESQHIYTDADGNPKLRVTRAIDLASGTKKFWQHHFKNENWVKGGSKEEFAPYRFIDWANKSEPIFHVEGEKKADRLAEEGLLVSTSPGGANAWKVKLAKYYQGKDVIVLPDNDKAGQEYAFRAARDIAQFANSVKIIDLPDLEEAEDIYDWLESGRAKEELLSLCETARSLGPEDFAKRRVAEAPPEYAAGEIGDELDGPRYEPNSKDYNLSYRNLKTG